MIQLKAHAQFIAYGICLPLLCSLIRLLSLWTEINSFRFYVVAFIISILVGYYFDSLPASSVEPILKSRLLRLIVDVGSQIELFVCSKFLISLCFVVCSSALTLFCTLHPISLTVFFLLKLLVAPYYFATKYIRLLDPSDKTCLLHIICKFDRAYYRTKNTDHSNTEGAIDQKAGIRWGCCGFFICLFSIMDGDFVS